MKTIYKRPPKPRYLTIKIQYYPISKKIILLPIIFLLLFALRYSINNFSFFSASVSPTHSLSFLHEAYALTQETENSVPTPSVKSDQVVFHGLREKKQIALTFDADMTPGMKTMLERGEVASYYDKQIIDILNQTQTKATLFLTGMWIEVYQQEAKELASNSLFELANHSYSHPSFAGECYGLGEIPDSQNEEQIVRTQTLLQELTGKRNTLFRFPGGCYTENDLVSTKNANLTVIQWDVAGRDGFNDDATAIENNVIPFVQNGSIIVLHMSGYPNAPKTAEALPVIIEQLKEKGYEFVTVSELFNEDKTIQALEVKNLLSFP